MAKRRTRERTNRPDKRSAPQQPMRFSERLNDAYGRLAEAQAARDAGRISASIKILEPLIDDYPDYVAALHNLGLAHLAKQAYWPALSCFVRASMLNPEDWTILTSLAQCYVGLESNEMAIHVLEQARAFEEDKAEIHYTLGVIYEREREYEAAAQSFRRALELDPDHIGAVLSSGQISVHLGDFEQAADAFARSHKTKPGLLAPIVASAQLPTGFARFDVPAALDQVRREKHENLEDHQIRLAFANAHLLHRSGEHKAAWDMLRRANRPLRRRIEDDVARHKQRRVARLEMAREHVASGTCGIPDDERYPVSLFIVGTSRSGKTTLERTLSATSGVKRGYENPIVERAVTATAQTAGLLTIRQLGDLPIELYGKFRGIYLKHLLTRADGAKVFTSTHPGRTSDVGLLSRIVPNARFVFVNRNRNDAALRIFMKHFREGGNFYAYDMGDVLAELDWCSAMFDVWENVKSVQHTTVSYEDLVVDPVAELTKLGELCALEIDTQTIPPTGDDRSCGEPYAAWIADANT